ncbi:MAG TPA: BON domain-containing protein [Streptosporangiaceae bacterium]|jgi:osmotically-inducible protein OsmY|nr:BON domain-containing protein [Streptosporangiaceae bacterium]
MTRDTSDYVAGRIERALASDPRTHELGIRADVRDGVVILRGEVACEQRRLLIAEVVRDAAPELDVRNEVSVPELQPPGEEEKLT